MIICFLVDGLQSMKRAGRSFFGLGALHGLNEPDPWSPLWVWRGVGGVSRGLAPRPTKTLKSEGRARVVRRVGRRWYRACALERVSHGCWVVTPMRCRGLGWGALLGRAVGGLQGDGEDRRTECEGRQAGLLKKPAPARWTVGPPGWWWWWRGACRQGDRGGPLLLGRGKPSHGLGVDFWDTRPLKVGISRGLALIPIALSALENIKKI